MSDPTPTPRVLVRESDRGPAHAAQHPYNPASEIHGWILSRATGLERIAVNLAWLPPGKESAIYHLHHREEEWMFVLEGRGIAEIDGAELEVGPGDFLGFAPGVAHHLRNPGPGRLLFLEGGEVISDVEVADFPRLARRVTRCGTKAAVYPFDAEVPFLPGGVEMPEVLGGGTRAKAQRVLVRAAERQEARIFRHPENPASEIHLVGLSRPTGLQRVAVGLSQIPPGKEAYVFHVHQHDEEWMYVVSGHGIAEVGEDQHELRPGDFLGFVPRGPAHNTRASGPEPLVYLCGGDAWSKSTVEIVDFPRLGLRRTMVGTRSAMTFPLSAALEGTRDKGA
jgi:quercetin 2,3-dioxygenase